MKTGLFNDLSISNKIFAGYMAVLLVACVLLAASAAMTFKAKGLVDEVSETLIPEVIALEALREKGMRVSNAADRLAFSAAAAPAAGAPSAHQLTLLRASLTRAIGKFENALTRLPAGTADGERGALVRDLASVAADLSGKVAVLIAASTSGDGDRLLEVRGAIELDTTALGDFISRITRAHRKLLADGQGELDAYIDITLSIGLIGMLLLFVGTILGGRAVIARIVRPLQALREAMAAFAEGRPAPAAIDAPNDEIGALVGSFGDMTRQLSEAKEKLSRSERLSTLGQIAGTVSHELRNPLASIHNSMQLIQRLTAGKNLGVERALDRVDRNIERCNRIVGDILEFTRAKQLDRRPLEFDSWLSEMLEEHEVPGGVPVERDLRCSSQASIDSTRFRQVIVNLVDNAAQALTDRSWQAADGHVPRIVVRTEQAGPHIKLSVVDNGPGIPADKLPKIFEPLFTTKTAGVGLGLPTVRQLVEQHGGTVDVESRIGQTTTFTIWLPRYSAETAAQAAASQAIAAA